NTCLPYQGKKVNRRHLPLTCEKFLQLSVVPRPYRSRPRQHKTFRRATAPLKRTAIFINHSNVLDLKSFYQCDSNFRNKNTRKLFQHIRRATVPAKVLKHATAPPKRTTVFINHSNVLDLKSFYQCDSNVINKSTRMLFQHIR